MADRLADNPSLLAALRCAKSLNISYKRFRGWTPSDGDTIEWDDTEQLWMLALDLYERTRICPLCGMDMGICHDEERFNSMFKGADVYMCFASQAREFALKRYGESGIVEAPHSQTTRLTPRQ